RIDAKAPNSAACRGLLRLLAETSSTTAQHLGPRRGEEIDEAPRGWRQAAVFLPYRADVPARLGVAERDLDERGGFIRRAWEHRDPKAGPHKSAQRFMLFALERQSWGESRSLAQCVK